MNTPFLNSDPVVRRGLERWENEGGRIRFDLERSNRWNPARDGGHWHHDLSKISMKRDRVHGQICPSFSMRNHDSE